jgi:Tol biopolymer transport system component
MFSMIRSLFLLSIGVMMCGSLLSQASLKLEDIMKGEDFMGYLPDDISWTIDNSHIVFRWRKNDVDTIRKYYVYSLAEDSIFYADSELLTKVPARNILWSADLSFAIWSKYGDIFLWNENQKTLKRLTYTIDNESVMGLSQDDESIYFRQGDNIFSFNLKDQVISQLSNFKKGKESPLSDPQGAEKWLEDDNLSLFEVLSRKKNTSNLQKEYNKSLESKYPKAIWYGDLRLENQVVSPDAKYITYRLLKSKPGKATDVPDYMNTNGYTTNLRAREKVGTGSNEYSSYIYQIDKDTVIKMDMSDLPGIRTKPSFMKEYHTDTTAFSSEFKDPKAVIIHGPFFSRNGSAFVDIKSLDNKDRWLAMINLETGKLECFDHQHDEAWIGGPGISSWNGVPGNVAWMKDQKRIMFQSEKTGYSHLYMYDIESQKITALTSGDFEVLNTTLSRDGSIIFITANAEGPHQQHFYHLSLADGLMTRITTAIGGHEVSISHDESNLAIRHSFSNKPWELFLMKNEKKAEMRGLTQSTSQAFNK